MSRRKMPKNKDKKYFRNTANTVQSLNLRAQPMRGGFRI